MASDALPDAIGPYRIESELGRGMMGVVYKAKDTRSKRAVALKIIRMAFVVSDEQKASFERRFTEEAQIVARLEHPGIVGVYEVGRDPEQDAPFIAFEYLEGQTLGEMLEQGPLPWRTAFLIVARVAEALEHAHRQGVIHRDIKPANVMVLRNGEPKIMDFGLAKRDAGLELTSTGQFLGTPLYMSPEQALGRKVDARTDIFSLGSVAYTMLTGKRAFEGDSIPQVMNKVTYQNPPPPTKLMRDLPAEADYLIARSMAKAPDHRYANAFTFAEDLNDVWHGRKPRHRAGWTPPDIGAGTMVAAAPARGDTPSAGRRKGGKRKSGASSIDDLPLLELTPMESAPSPLIPPPRRGGGARSAGWGLLLLAVVGAGLFWRAEIFATLTAANRKLIATAPRATPTETRLVEVVVAPSPTTRATEAPPSTPSLASTEAPTVAPTVAPTEEPRALVTAAPPETREPRAKEAPATAAPTAVPRRTPRKTPTSRARPRPAAEASKLSFVLEHHYKSGTVRVWVDDDKVVDESLTSRVTQDLKVVKIRKGRFQRVLGVAPGTHRIRVELKSGEDIRAKESTAVFKSGVTRRLEASTNRVTGGLSLDWE